jgi:diadenosine tetraphosphate (Ap4A) HIT family hydrolase
MRIVAVSDPLHPVFCRVIWQAHVREMTDLDGASRTQLMAAVFATEAALIGVFPHCKVNLASLGNLTPHLHWHVIARFADDPHFPDPVWAPARHAHPVAVPADWSQQVAARLAAVLGSAPATPPVASPAGLALPP